MICMIRQGSEILECFQIVIAIDENQAFLKLMAMLIVSKLFFLVSVLVMVLILSLLYNVLDSSLVLVWLILVAPTGAPMSKTRCQMSNAKCQ